MLRPIKCVNPLSFRTTAKGGSETRRKRFYTVKPRAPIVESVQIRGHSVLPQKSHAATWGCGEAPKAYVNLLTNI